jgi:hypothetical protein
VEGLKIVWILVESPHITLFVRYLDFLVVPGPLRALMEAQLDNILGCVFYSSATVSLMVDLSMAPLSK